jgi:hypothetical protein
MRLPPNLLESIGFVVATDDELIGALGDAADDKEKQEISRLFALGLPPVTSINALSVMTGFNRGFVWSLVERPEKYYRRFTIQTGTKFRNIEAPRVSLKIVQKWLSHHFEKAVKLPQSVHGFVKGRSHLTAAAQHLGAEWVASFDIRDFFPTTDQQTIQTALSELGYKTDESIDIVSKLCCLGGRLSQGSPASPVLSNLVLSDVDEQLNKVATKYDCKHTRYADDIVFSGLNKPPPNIENDIEEIFGKRDFLCALTAALGLGRLH